MNCAYFFNQQMKLAMNWGWKIALGYSAFVVFMLALVIGATQQEFHLVKPNYYEAEVAYEQQIIKIRNARALPQAVQIEWEAEEQALLLAFPSMGEIQGEVVLYRPDDAKADRKLRLSPDAEGVQRIPLAGLKPGLWRVKLDWEAAQKGYYQEKTMVIP